MKTIIAGGRDITDPEILDKALKLIDWEITEVVCGMAKGADTLGLRWAQCNGIVVKPFPAKWREFGNAAGPIRNSDMALYAEALLALWDGQSKGTKDMIKKAMSRKLKIFVYRTDLDIGRLFV